MALKDELERRIEKKRREINDFYQKIKAAEVYIHALEDTLKLVSAEERDTPKAIPLPSAPTDALRSGSKTDRAREILRAAGSPMHIMNLLEAMGEKADAESRAALAGALSAYVRDGKVFTRPKPNTFGLIEFGDIKNEPPPGFGSDEVPSSEPEVQSGIGDDDVPF